MPAPIAMPYGANNKWNKKILTDIGNNTNKKNGVKRLNNKNRPLIISNPFKNGKKYPEPKSPALKAVACALITGGAILRKG